PHPVKRTAPPELDTGDFARPNLTNPPIPQIQDNSRRRFTRRFRLITSMDGTTVRQSSGRKGTPQAEAKSKLPQSVAEVLKQHVVLEVESIDRMYLNVIVGRLQILEGALRFIREQRKAQVLSTNAVGADDAGFRAGYRTVRQGASNSAGDVRKRTAQGRDCR